MTHWLCLGVGEGTLSGCIGQSCSSLGLGLAELVAALMLTASGCCKLPVKWVNRYSGSF